MSNLSTQERIDLIKSVGEEIVGEDELAALLSSGKDLITYDGFEPSGQMHIAQGIQRAINVNKMIKAGFKFKMLVADWYGYLNNKMGGDIEKIKTVGMYFIELWKASGMDLDGVEFVWTSDMLKDPKYWELVMRVARSNSLKRILKTTQIMGRSESDDLSAAMIFYPCMQTADVFTLGAQVTQLGMDQRKVNVLAREVGPQLGFWKPIVVSHHMLQGLGVPKVDRLVTLDFALKDVEWDVSILEEGNYRFELIKNHGKYSLTTTDLKTNKVEWDYFLPSEVKDEKGYKLEKKLGVEKTIKSVQPEEVLVEIKLPVQDSIDRAIDIKMSKSIPDSAIFMTDTREDIQRKINKAYAPEGIVEENPILEYCKYLIFEAIHLKGQEDLLKDGFVVKRPEKFGGDVTYKTYNELEKDYADKKLFPLDLKNAVVEYVDKLVEPVRKHFATDAHAKELLEKVQSYQVTR